MCISTDHYLRRIRIDGHTLVNLHTYASGALACKALRCALPLEEYLPVVLQHEDQPVADFVVPHQGTGLLRRGHNPVLFQDF